MVNLELYRVFCAVARHRSLTKAAEELYISQPAVSQAIKQLESQLGTQLFHRTNKGMELTAQGGELIYEDAKTALGLLNEAENKLFRLREEASGTLRIGASETIFQYCLSEKIVQFHREFPHVKLELSAEVSPQSIERLKTDRCDVAFLNLPLSETDGLRLTDTIMPVHDIFLAGNAFAELKGQKMSLRSLREYPLLLMEEHTVARACLDRFLAAQGIELTATVEVNSWHFMKKLVADGMGIGCIPREYALNKLRDGTLFEIETEQALPVRGVGIALPKNGSPSFALRKFLSLF